MNLGKPANKWPLNGLSCMAFKLFVAIGDSVAMK